MSDVIVAVREVNVGQGFKHGRCTCSCGWSEVEHLGLIVDKAERHVRNAHKGKGKIATGEYTWPVTKGRRSAR